MSRCECRPPSGCCHVLQPARALTPRPPGCHAAASLPLVAAQGGPGATTKLGGRARRARQHKVAHARVRGARRARREPERRLRGRRVAQQQLARRRLHRYVPRPPAPAAPLRPARARRCRAPRRTRLLPQALGRRGKRARPRRCSRSVRAPRMTTASRALARSLPLHPNPTLTGRPPARLAVQARQ